MQALWDKFAKAHGRYDAHGQDLRCATRLVIARELIVPVSTLVSIALIGLSFNFQLWLLAPGLVLLFGSLALSVACSFKTDAIDNGLTFRQLKRQVLYDFPFLVASLALLSVGQVLWDAIVLFLLILIAIPASHLYMLHRKGLGSDVRKSM